MKFQRLSDSVREKRMTSVIVAITSILIVTSLFFGFWPSIFTVALFFVVLPIFWLPRVGMYAIIVLTVLFERFYTLQPVLLGRVAYKLYPLDIFLAVVFFSVFIVLFMKKGSLKLQFADGIFLVFLAYITGILFREMLFPFSGVDMGVAFSTWKNYVFYGLSYFALPILLNKKEHLFRLIGVFLFSASVATLFLAIGIVSGEGLWTEYTPLSTSGVRLLAFPHAFYFSMAILILWYSSHQWLDRSRKERGIAFGVLLLWIVGVAGSLMRHLWLGMALSALAVWPFLPRVQKASGLKLARFFMFIGIVVAFVGVYFWALFPGSDFSLSIESAAGIVSERVLSIQSSSDESVAWRGAVWGSALSEVSRSLVFGTGFGVAVPVEMSGYRDFVEMRNMHNSWLALFIQTGVLGFGLFVLFFVALLVKVLRTSNHDEWSRSIRFGTIGIALFHSAVFLSQPYLETNLLALFFWINLGVMRTFLKLSV